jgi:hypothetical protein
MTMLQDDIREPLAAEPDAPPAPAWWRPQFTTLAAIAAVLVWWVIQLARYVGEAPDLDPLIGYRGSVILYENGFGGLVNGILGEGIHPPLMDLLNFISFMFFGTDPRSIQLMGIALFVLFVVGAERLLQSYIPSATKRVVAAFAVTICPALAISFYFVLREGMIVVILVSALAIALAGRAGNPRPLALGLVLALLPLTKETGLVFVVPFAVDAFLTGDKDLRARIRRVAYVLGIPIAAALAWRLVVMLGDGKAWSTWVFSERSEDGPYTIVLRAMFGFEDGIYLRQNLANAFIVNYLWLPAMLALISLVLIIRRPAAAHLRRPAAIIVGLIAIYSWTVLTFPTFTEPRYAAPVIALTILLVLIGLGQWPQRAQPVILGALLFAFIAGAWSPTDPVTRKIWGTSSVGGELIYNTSEFWRGPDRMDVNFQLLNASERMNERLRRIYASGATIIVGDCNAMKFGEKLATVGDYPGAFDRGIPGAHPLRCVFPKDLPPGTADGPEKVALIRTPEEDAAAQPPAITGKSVVVIH